MLTRRVLTRQGSGWPHATVAQFRSKMAPQMKFGSLAAALCLALMICAPAHGDETGRESTLICSVGPIEKTYGKTKWLIYSCDDRRSVVMVSAPGSPANPFVFRFLARGNAYVLQSQGTGNREHTAAAFAELKEMSGQDIATLVKLTEAWAKH